MPRSTRSALRADRDDPATETVATKNMKITKFGCFLCDLRDLVAIRLRGYSSLWLSFLWLFVLRSGCALRGIHHRSHEHVLRHGTHDLDRPIDDRLRHAGDAVLAGEIHELGRLNAGSGDVPAFERHLVRQADRPGTVRSCRRDEHADGGRLF